MNADEQPSLFDQPASGSSRPVTIGRAHVEYRDASSILTRASGFMSDYDFTLNPYSGCTFGCTYCYAAFFTRDLERQRTWGDWVVVKGNALERLRRMRTDLNGARVYLGSVTDPYQPIERRLGLVRSLLPVLAERGVRLVVQTRSPDAARDIELFRTFEHIRINMTVTTDSEEVRRAFEPGCPTTNRRIRGIATIADAGVPTAITMTPLLPLEDPTTFAQALLDTGVTNFVVQPFHADRGRFVAGTGARAQEVIHSMGWSEASYRSAVDILRSTLPELLEGRAGFAPA